MPLPADSRDVFLVPEGVLYFDTASNAPRTRAVDAALRAAWQDAAAPWRLSHADWEEQVERVRALASRMFRADHRADPEAVALVPSVAHAMSMAAAGWPLGPGDTVGIVDGEFPSALLPWQHRCATTGARLQAVPREDATRGFLKLLDTAPALLVLSHVHWRDGRLLDLDRVAMAAREHGVPVVLDLSQSLGVLPCDVARWRPAFAMSVGYKWLLAHKGLSAMWVAPEWRERMAPLEHHWQGRLPERPWTFAVGTMAPYQQGARRFDGGEVADPLRMAILETSLSQVLEWTPAAIAARLEGLLSRLRGRLDATGLGDWCVSPAAPHLLGIAPPVRRLAALHERFARGGVVSVERDGVFRLAPHLHVDEQSIDRVATAIIAAR